MISLDSHLRENDGVSKNFELAMCRLLFRYNIAFSF